MSQFQQGLFRSTATYDCLFAGQRAQRDVQGGRVVLLWHFLRKALLASFGRFTGAVLNVSASARGPGTALGMSVWASVKL